MTVHHRARGVELRRACSFWLQILAALALLLSHTRSASAEDIDVQRFTPYATSGGFLQTEGTQTRYPVDPFSLGVWLTFAYQPLVVVNGSDETGKIVGAQVGLDITAAYAFATWFELGVHAPLSYLSGDDLSAAALGDLRLLPKFTFLRDDRGGIGIGIITELRLPTHTNQFTGGARNLAGAPRFLIDHRFGLSGFRLGLDLGLLLREATHYRNVTAASEIQAGLGLGYRFDGGRAPVELLFDLRTGVGLAEADPEEMSMEAMGGVAIDLTPEWKFHAAAGLGLLEGFGVPTFRALAGLRWEPSPNDPDHDGLGTSKQLLEKQSENLDPNATQPPEDPGAVANVDAVDDKERADAIRDGYDACPTLPEDIDGDEDEDGCPEGDADGDGVLDYLDQCEGEEETINGFKDDDGCPDEGPAQIIIEGGKITILETIRFRPNSSEIDSGSYPMMDQIALALRKHKELDRVEIGGHTDSTGPREYNMRLSRARARSVRQYLLARGIPPARLSARGYGPDKPIGDNNTDDGRTKNRRVEFLANP
jgi:outer membrane protein OmpA-like peptidoglycan-associated protein